MSLTTLNNLPEICGEIPIMKFLGLDDKLHLCQAVEIIYDVKDKHEKIVRKLKEKYVLNQAYQMLIASEFREEGNKFLKEAKTIDIAIYNDMSNKFPEIKKSWKQLHLLYREIFIKDVKPFIYAIWRDDISLNEMIIILNEAMNWGSGDMIYIHFDDLDRLYENENIKKFFKHLSKKYELSKGFLRCSIDFLCILFNNEIIHKIYLKEEDE